MTTLERIHLLRRLDGLIQRKATGMPCELADRLNVSRASLFRYLNELKNLGAPLEYCRLRRSYFYSDPFDFLC